MGQIGSPSLRLGALPKQFSVRQIYDRDYRLIDYRRRKVSAQNSITPLACLDPSPRKIRGRFDNRVNDSTTRLGDWTLNSILRESWWNRRIIARNQRLLRSARNDRVTLIPRSYMCVCVCVCVCVSRRQWWNGGRRIPIVEGIYRLSLAVGCQRRRLAVHR